MPNQLTLLRILLTFVLCGVVDGDRRLFVAVFLMAGATDVLDGYLARRLGLVSEFGVRFDSLADRLLIAAGTWCLWRLRPEVFSEHAAWWGLAASILLVPQLTALLKLGRSAGFHLYTGKAAYLLAFFWFLWTILAGYHPLLHSLLLLCFAIKSLEVLAVCLLVEDPYSDLRPSIFHYLRKR
jgi:phosphatidylglycerophosphate synthase